MKDWTSVNALIEVRLRGGVDFSQTSRLAPELLPHLATPSRHVFDLYFNSRSAYFYEDIFRKWP